ncbi:MAG: ATP-binding protein [Fimbriimonas sp.]|nr:ATP-binding protein [Fimbriimonas sp.]
MGSPEVMNTKESTIAGDACSLRVLLDSLPLIAWAVSADGVPLYYNTKWFAYTGLSPLKPVHLVDVIHPDDFQAAMEKRMTAYASGCVYEVEFRLRRFDGEYRWHHTSSEPMRDETGKILRYLKTTVDIQAEREMESLNADLDRRVLERTAELERANAELEAFTYHVAHDLRAPLRAITAKARILEEDYRQFLPDEAIHLIHRQVQSANKLGVLVDELLKLTRLSRMQAQCEEVDLSSIARDVVTELMQGGFSARVEVQDDLYAVADPRLLRLLLGNLISNAIQYSPQGGLIEVGKAVTDCGEAFFVRDHGIGFDMEFVNKIFEPFERLVNDVEFPGTGVGLANVARIVAKHKGAVWAVGAPGKGSTFYFTLSP